MDTNNSGFSVLAMAQQMASQQNTDVAGLFAMNESNNPPVPSVEETPQQEAVTEVKDDKVTPIRREKKPWTPDASLVEDMPEIGNTPLTYSKDEYKEKEDIELKNMLDEDAQKEAIEAMDEMSRTAANIEAAKKRHGISKFKIPEGQYHALITAAAGDTNYDRAQKGLDDIFDEIEREHPDFILERIETKERKPVFANPVDHGNIIDIPEGATDQFMPADFGENEVITSNTGSEEVKIYIDKTNVSQVAWTQEELEKIKKARSVELNIVETAPLEYSEIEDADSNAIDTILSQYQRKSNDVVAVLPASKYRATFIGLSYPEVLDLSNSQELDNIDGERKKWSICFDHIRNQSIGPWREYQWYIDPNTKKRVEISYTAPIPPGINEDDVHSVSKFEDFLMKTSFMDLEFMLWKILCATAMEKEVISVTCHAMYQGSECKKSYDWVYAPNDLLVTDSISEVVLEEMKKTGEVSTYDDIIANYKSSMLMTNNCVKLPTSGIHVVFGHISAYEYLNNIYGKIKELEEGDNNDPTLVSKSMAYTTLTVIKALIVNYNGKKVRITGVDNLVKMINSLDEIDWQTISELVRIMVEPYTFSFALRDLECPKCHTKSNIPIESISRLLFIVARSLSSVQVVLKRT